MDTAQKQGISISTHVEILLEIDYMKRLEGLKLKHGGKFHSYNKLYVTTFDESYLGDRNDLIKLAEQYGVEGAEESDVIEEIQIANSETTKLLKGYDLVYFKFVSTSATGESKQYKKIVIQL